MIKGIKLYVCPISTPITNFLSTRLETAELKAFIIYRIIGWVRLGKTLKSNPLLNTAKATTKACTQVLHPHITSIPPRLVTPPLHWAAVPGLGNPFDKYFFPNVQSNPPSEQLQATTLSYFLLLGRRH